MKKLIFILITLSFLFVKAECLLIERQHTPVWKTINDNKGVENLVAVALKGEKFQIVEEKVSWYFVEILSSKNSNAIEKRYWITSKVVIEKDAKYFIGLQGCTGRIQPVVNQNDKVFLFNNSEIRLLDKVITKVKVQFCNGQTGWIYTANGKIISE